MKCPATFIVNGEPHYCKRRRDRHWGKHRSTFADLFHDYTGRLIATSRVSIVWSDWDMEVSS